MTNQLFRSKFNISIKNTNLADHPLYNAVLASFFFLQSVFGFQHIIQYNEKKDNKQSLLDTPTQ